MVTRSRVTGSQESRISPERPWICILAAPPESLVCSREPVAGVGRGAGAHEDDRLSEHWLEHHLDGLLSRREMARVLQLVALRTPVQHSRVRE